MLNHLIFNIFPNVSGSQSHLGLQSKANWTAGGVTRLTEDKSKFAHKKKTVLFFSSIFFFFFFLTVETNTHTHIDTHKLHFFFSSDQAQNRIEEVLFYDQGLNDVGDAINQQGAGNKQKIKCGGRMLEGGLPSLLQMEHTNTANTLERLCSCLNLLVLTSQKRFF